MGRSSRTLTFRACSGGAKLKKINVSSWLNISVRFSFEEIAASNSTDSLLVWKGLRKPFMYNYELLSAVTKGFVPQILAGNEYTVNSMLKLRLQTHRRKRKNSFRKYIQKATEPIDITADS